MTSSEKNSDGPTSLAASMMTSVRRRRSPSGFSCSCSMCVWAFSILFPTTVRALGVGLPYALTVSIFGGTTDSVALWLKSLGSERWFYYYLTGMIGISLVVYLFMRYTKADSAMHRHE